VRLQEAKITIGDLHCHNRDLRDGKEKGEERKEALRFRKTHELPSLFSFLLFFLLGLIAV
jgi:hypothetical protein